MRLVDDRPILEVRGVSLAYSSGKLFSRRNERALAVDDVSLVIRRGEALGIVGESGSGKSSLAKIITGLVPPDTGSVIFDGTDLLRTKGAARRKLGRRLQMVFQDPYSSLNPTMTLQQLVTEPLVIHGLAHGAEELERRCVEILEQVSIDPGWRRRYPGALSGGQRQRIAIARALASSPDLIVCDEPVSALDASIRAQVLNVLVDLQRDHGVGTLFIAHDLAIVRHVCDRVAVMHKGRIVEVVAAADIPDKVQHPYTKALLAANPSPLRAADPPGGEGRRLS
ncbi:ATP-binding cassette domain-containing protein [Microbacterium sp. ASV81]|uniref:ATP-binding cassette domain-containing protein n=1 Tax=Microbacterium capsulatum TaxID=3041921 RepID=A0ABU0XD98_9MICO|nr:ATP-binding cassette domain-containing protein [Microbacterium sp. ASV81]MDQ4213085.1 ATP-binding cassette domain-containing protein [Microbacterium sp. ASV81]